MMRSKLPKLAAEHDATTSPLRCCGGRRRKTAAQPRSPPARKMMPMLTGMNHHETASRSVTVRERLEIMSAGVKTA